MKISFLSLITLLMFYSFNVMALHHEPQDAQNIQLSNDSSAKNEGVVVDVIDTTGYTYMELENAGGRFWIAAPTTQVKKGDHIRYVKNMTMSNFTSKTLNRTFTTLIFVTSTEIKK
ncbi:hypothetical protein W03_13150 [Nitrosomonas sp. PY1]|uniref:hypothetical protein n=1 Tax=Nitrosomonas sp. PY1 TaxID=1803906 RepID=UPI001FC7FF9A|nr:hypothetical protein [Nitrosomonas sp. PY1]GKS69311.1 hypothetical protein W03_13150 [Nitrosomonas sp. PY1]